VTFLVYKKGNRDERAGRTAIMNISPIGEIREVHGLTQLDLAIIAGVSQSYISQLELGGAHLNKRLKNALEQVGEDPDQVARRQDDFTRRTKRRLKDQTRRQTAALPLPCDARPKKNDAG